MTPAPLPFRVAVAGIGGFAAQHHEALLTLEEEGIVRVVAACDPRQQQLGEEKLKFRFEERGILVRENFEEMIEAQQTSVDLAVIASPVQFHAAMHRLCASLGLLCYLEKPPTLDPSGLESMIRHDAALSQATNVGFFFAHQDFRRNLKKRILSGEFGKVIKASLLGLSRRTDEYFHRNNWAGRLTWGNDLLLDSCFGNAMAHSVNILLYLLGPQHESSWARPVSLKAELYRAYEIEGADTVFARAELGDGVPLSVVLSHACTEKYHLVERIELERAIIEIRENKEVSISWREGGIELSAAPLDTLIKNLRRHISYLTGNLDGPAVSLRDCRGLVEFNAMLYVAAPEIKSIGREHCRAQPGGTASSRAINQLKETADLFLGQGIFPSQSGRPWGSDGGQCTASSIGELASAVRRHLRQAGGTRPNAS